MPIPSLLLIHGAATGAWLWDLWRRELGALGWQVNVIDLRGHGRSMPIDLATVTMEDYVADLASVTVQIEAAQGVHPIIGGWGTGALVAMMYVAQHDCPGLLLVEPALPVEAGGKASIEEVRQASGGLLGPDAFGVYPGDRTRSRASLPALSEGELDALLLQVRDEQESGIAYRQVLRGISVAPGAITSPSLIVSAQDGLETALALTRYLQGEHVSVPFDGRWSIVCHEPAVAAAATLVDGWLQSTLASGKAR